ncbi:serine hydrolase domain-containing protein [Frateuria hangzhouensis]|uniref:serine hydrolase domain-containing protein n=1 Tax=Frateuria hangzhouensis TaxID=2995589 RepID=UPI002260959D|nr:serine hydrolase domain-containing protein [Frateuria sp. STR12]MCX7514734.1 serine hydrolase [Frateuria sp. STR12]
MPTFLRRSGFVFAWALALPTLAAAAPGAGTPKPSVERAAARIAQALATVQQTPNSFPAYSAVFVHGADERWIYVNGRVREDRPTPADADTLFYIASQTKSFMGLLAAELDRKGVFPLDTTLAQVWPKLALPAPVDPARVTMTDLLSHQEGLRTDTLNVVTAYVRDIPPADYPRLLASETRARDPGFRYANLGDLVYGAALEARTGRNWRDWLDAEVLGPLALDHVVSRPSRADAATLSWNHQWDGSRWHTLPPKPDALMHAAGGLLASSNDMARWMRANLRPGKAGTPIDAGALRLAQRPIAKADLADREIDCNGYSLGWYTCTYKGQRALMHPGSYTGAVSVTVLVPSADAGMAVMVNSDSATEGLELDLMKAFIGLVTGQPGEQARLDKAVASYPARLAAKTRGRLDAIAKARARPEWKGWAWHPAGPALQAFTGRFHNALFGAMEVSEVDGRLQASIGAMRLALEPARPGLFGATSGPIEPPEPLRFDAARRSIRWNGQVFTR